MALATASGSSIWTKWPASSITVRVEFGKISWNSRAVPTLR
jgi:hypothetical protein